jgi:hypothetical protein
MSLQNLWVQHQTFIDLVSTEGCTYIAQFLKKIRKEFEIPGPASQLTLYQLKDMQEVEIKPTATFQSLGNAGKEGDAPLIVKTAAVTKSSRLVTTRKMSVEASCRKYLDAIAKRLAEFYEFGYRFTSGATIGDVLEAKDGVEGEDWDVRKAKKTQNQIDDDGFVVQIRKGQPLTKVKLPDLYTADEWDKISKFNKKTTTRIYSATLPTTSNGKPYIIIPHSEFTEEMISFLKSIGVKASLFSSPDDLEVKDEDLLSDSSFIVLI